LDDFFIIQEKHPIYPYQTGKNCFEKDFIPVVPDWSEFFIFLFFLNPIPVAAGNAQTFAAHSTFLVGLMGRSEPTSQPPNA
jgi:hypothetical protein